MNERTQIHVGTSRFQVPKLTKRVLEAVMGTALTAIAVLSVLTINNMLTGKSGWYGGYSAWLKFMERTDIVGTMILTAIVTVAFVYWYRDHSTRR